MYNPKTFFKNTYCEFTLVHFDFSGHKTVTSKSGSVYHYTEKGVYRYSNHWGRVANCRWRIENIRDYKSQNWYIGYASWSDFYNLNSSEKIFSLWVDFTIQQVSLIISSSDENFKFSIADALKRKQEIESVFKNPKYLLYSKNENIHLLKQQIIQSLVTSDEKMDYIKRQIVQ